MCFPQLSGGTAEFFLLGVLPARDNAAGQVAWRYAMPRV
jgi:hypothetical protein